VGAAISAWVAAPVLGLEAVSSADKSVYWYLVFMGKVGVRLCLAIWVLLRIFDFMIGGPARRRERGQSWGTMMASLLALAVGAKIASAAAQGLPATDNELYAGYCLGVSETIPSSLQNSPLPAEAEQELQRRRQRFASYLVSRGVLLSMERTDAFLGVLAAIGRGRADARDCFDQTDRCSAAPQPQLDMTKPLTEDTKRQFLEAWARRDRGIQACVARSLESSVCVHVVRCAKPDDLPF
jgi:hypothetical protein